MSRRDRFLRACRREAVDATPVWFMRQAGRYLPEYRALRRRHPFLDLVRTPELAAEITLQPVRIFEVDAAILFADILPLLEAVGLKVAFGEGEGPVVMDPVGSADDVARLALRPVEEVLGPTLEAARLVRGALDGAVPLIGFSGAPFTLACYAVEGRGSAEFARARAFMRAEPAAWHALMHLLSAAVGDYLRAQRQAGAQALQVFDSWAGLLSADEYREFAAPYSAAAIRNARSGEAPVIHFSTRTARPDLLPLVRDAGGDVIGVDAGMPLAEAWRCIGHDRAVQGNLAPDLLLGSAEAMTEAARGILDSVRGRPGHIFNLGHGIRKETPVENVRSLVDCVHAFSKAGRQPE